MYTALGPNGVRDNLPCAEVRRRRVSSPRHIAQRKKSKAPGCPAHSAPEHRLMDYKRTEDPEEA